MPRLQSEESVRVLRFSSGAGEDGNSVGMEQAR